MSTPFLLMYLKHSLGRPPHSHLTEEYSGALITPLLAVVVWSFSDPSPNLKSKLVDRAIFSRINWCRLWKHRVKDLRCIMEIPSNTANKQKAVKALGNIQALEIVGGTSMAPTSRGSGPAPLAPVPSSLELQVLWLTPQYVAFPRIPSRESYPQPCWEPFNR